LVLVVKWFDTDQLAVNDTGIY